MHGAEISVAAQRLVAEIFALQEQVDLAEVGSAAVVPFPALAHQVVDLAWTVYRVWQQNL